ncbi:MAG: hypothetical protein ACI4SD_01450, partial [Suilimivivens sp.]
MKLKYYLRGLGTGIIVTAVILGITLGNKKETLSDREIMERAAELGMVEQGGSLADMEKTQEPSAKPTQQPEKTEKPSEEPMPTQIPVASEKP